MPMPRIKNRKYFFLSEPLMEFLILSSLILSKCFMFHHCLEIEFFEVFVTGHGLEGLGAAFGHDSAVDDDADAVAPLLGQR